MVRRVGALEAARLLGTGRADGARLIQQLRRGGTELGQALSSKVGWRVLLVEVGGSEADGEEEAEGSAEERTKLIALEKVAEILHDNEILED